MSNYELFALVNKKFKDFNVNCKMRPDFIVFNRNANMHGKNATYTHNSIDSIKNRVYNALNFIVKYEMQANEQL